MEIKGKTAIVTGGGTGIGRACSLMLAERGANVVIVYSRSEDDAKKTLDDVKRVGVDAIICKADVSKDTEVRQMVEKAEKHFGRIDVLINNAGTTSHVPIADLEGMKEEYWDDAFNTNVKGSFFVSRACARELKRNRGCIVNVTSISGITGRGSSISYCASKAAAISVTKSLALALAPDVRVNTVLPGVVLTRWIAWGTEEEINKLWAGTPLGHPASAEDVAQVVVSLVTGADFVTGQAVVVDGGFTMTLGKSIL